MSASSPNNSNMQFRRPCCRRWQQGLRKPRRQMRRWLAGPRFLQFVQSFSFVNKYLAQYITHLSKISLFTFVVTKFTCSFKDSPPSPFWAPSPEHLLLLFFLYLGLQLWRFLPFGPQTKPFDSTGFVWGPKGRNLSVEDSFQLDISS